MSGVSSRDPFYLQNVSVFNLRSSGTVPQEFIIQLSLSYYYYYYWSPEFPIILSNLSLYHPRYRWKTLKRKIYSVRRDQGYWVLLILIFTRTRFTPLTVLELLDRLTVSVVPLESFESLLFLSLFHLKGDSRGMKNINFNLTCNNINTKTKLW